MTEIKLNHEQMMTLLGELVMVQRGLELRNQGLEAHVQALNAEIERLNKEASQKEQSSAPAAPPVADAPEDQTR